MKRLLIALLCVATLHAEPTLIFSMPQKVGARNWNLAVDEEYAYFFQKEGGNALSGPVSASPLIVWKVKRANVPALSLKLRKFQEWAEVAKKNRVTDFKKEVRLEDVEIPHEVGRHVFLVAGGKINLSVEDYPNSFVLSEADVAATLSMTGKVPFTSGKPASTESLFK